MTSAEQATLEMVRQEMSDIRREMNDGFREVRGVLESRRVEDAKNDNVRDGRIARGEKLDFAIGLAATIAMGLLAHYGLGLG